MHQSEKAFIRCREESEEVLYAMSQGVKSSDYTHRKAQACPYVPSGSLAITSGTSLGAPIMRIARASLSTNPLLTATLNTFIHKKKRRIRTWQVAHVSSQSSSAARQPSGMRRRCLASKYTL